MYSVPIVPRHIWSSYSAMRSRRATPTRSSSAPARSRTEPARGTSQTLQWNRRDGWWATKAVGLRMPMKYIVDIHNTANTASLQNFLQNKIDLSNNFFPGIDKQIGGKVRTYYPKAPYMLSANTAWLVPNTTKKPLDDRVFRRALATAINIDQIVKADYGNIVRKADPTPAADVGPRIRQGQSKKLGFIQHHEGEGVRRVPATGHTVTASSRKGRVVDQPADHRPERVVGLADRDPDHRQQHEGRRNQLTPAYPDFKGWSTSATPASSTS